MTGYRYRGRPDWNPAEVPGEVEPGPSESFSKYRHCSHPRERCGACGRQGFAFSPHEHGKSEVRQYARPGYAPGGSGRHHG